jgi:hypothetical protein
VRMGSLRWRIGRPHQGTAAGRGRYFWGIFALDFVQQHDDSSHLPSGSEQVHPGIQVIGERC